MFPLGFGFEASLGPVLDIEYHEGSFCYWFRNIAVDFFIDLFLETFLYRAYPLDMEPIVSEIMIQRGWSEEAPEISNKKLVRLRMPDKRVSADDALEN